jgi:hypothetical protein
MKVRRISVMYVNNIPLFNALGTLGGGRGLSSSGDAFTGAVRANDELDDGDASIAGTSSDFTPDDESDCCTSGWSYGTKFALEIG